MPLHPSQYKEFNQIQSHKMRRNPGKLVIIRGGKKGRTFNSKEVINGKIPVYLENDDKPNTFHERAVLCDPKTMTVVGHID